MSQMFVEVAIAVGIAITVAAMWAALLHRRIVLSAFSTMTLGVAVAALWKLGSTQLPSTFSCGGLAVLGAVALIIVAFIELRIGITRDDDSDQMQNLEYMIEMQQPRRRAE